MTLARLIAAPALSHEQLRAAQRAVSVWIDVRTRHGYASPLTPAEAGHSALLRRLLSGKEPLPAPPPRAFSYPNYGLIESGLDDRAEAWRPERHQVLLDGDPDKVVVINQTQWTVEGEIDRSTLWVSHPRAPGRWKLTLGGPWQSRLERIEEAADAD
jgi:hypothetical protein